MVGVLLLSLSSNDLGSPAPLAGHDLVATRRQVVHVSSLNVYLTTR
jgi:hypothetical protein